MNIQIHNNETIPSKIPLLEYVSKHLDIEYSKPFKKHKILIVQHLLGSTLPLLSYIVKGGAIPSDIFIVGKAYSSHPLVVKKLIQRGYNVSLKDVFDFSVSKPYDATLEKHILKSTKLLLNGLTHNQKGLLIDDGGKAIRLLHNNYSNKLSQFACVEQTSRGTRLLKQINLNCPVINVARSHAKTTYESPEIARAMVDQFISLMTKWRQSNILTNPGNTIVLVGYGYIGQSVAIKLKNIGFKVYIYDNDIKNSNFAYLHGFSIIKNKNQIYNKALIIIGCTGCPILDENEYQKLQPGTFLVNMASTDTEFSAWNLRQKGKIIEQQITLYDKKYVSKYNCLPWRSLYRIDFPDTFCYLVNGGFPVDFSGSINPVPVENIQLTIGLLLAGAVQAIHENRTGLIDVTPKIQKLIVQKYLKYKQDN